MIDQLHHLSNTRPDAPFIFFEDQVLNFSTVDDVARRGGAWLTSLGIREGDHVMLAISNRPLFLFCWFSLAACGAVAVPVSHDTFGDPLLYMATQSESKMILTESAEKDRIVQTLSVTLESTAIEVISFDGENSFLQKITNFVPINIRNPRAGDPLAILYTSGTTGLPKGVVIPVESYRAAGKSIVNAIGVTEQDRILTFLPLHHANPQMYSLMSCLTVGCSMALVSRFSASRFLEQVQRYSATGFTYVGTVLSILAKEITQDVSSTLRFCVGGGAPRAVWQELAPRLGVHVHELYGMTETGGLVTVNTRKRHRFGSVGPVRDDFDVVVLDDEDNILSQGVGEIAVRPRQAHIMTSGYFKKPDETVKASSNFWFHTGDLGRFDEDGFLYFEGRKKELIRRAGEMISPVTIELAALKHECVADCAAVGVPDPIMEEEIKLVVVVRDTLKPTDLASFLAQSLPKHMLPRYVEFMTQIPKTPTQKVQRFKLTQMSDDTYDLKSKS